MINNPVPLSAQTIDLLKQLGTATVYEAQGAFGALDSGIKPLSPTMKMVGPAFTIDMRPADNLMIHYALLHARPGDVLVIECKGFMEAGVWGDVLTTQAMTLGLAGIVVNGAVRDAQAIVDLHFPAFARGLSIKGTGKHQPGAINIPVTIGDCVIHPGDIVIGDRDGVVIVPPATLDHAISQSVAREEKESRFKTAIEQGATTAELMHLAETFRRFHLE
ncbi:RraA family protein [Winslowiella iniecta]|uniref:Putative 4-hydroxy-4-methyl-2-oxoglutarate aldolase n=1 Tax=Winslowiella iniecta TaxID=1560201 RepID=A0A0L7T988_9GAMM|nr:RraA family protein [Winslowiella iniecta]KOC91933.1 4-hydroxy-4-methyl-2-oxoglutarate aldolase [Winslowiella iniecta]KOC94944.1 4-hydroxy-4-methyl-2-oxoglutarate aldolase [Winslowiella iniecta]